MDRGRTEWFGGTLPSESARDRGPLTAAGAAFDGGNAAGLAAGIADRPVPVGLEPGGTDGLLYCPELHAAFDRRDDRSTRGPASQLCDDSVPADLWHHVDEVRHSVSAVARATTACDFCGLDRQYRVQFGLRLDQPFQ